jgi:hypothetical protein
MASAEVVSDQTDRERSGLAKLRQRKGEVDSFWLKRSLANTTPDNNFDCLLEEWKAVRAELVSTMQVQQSILSFGTATIGLLLTAAFALRGKGDQRLRGDLLVVFLPLLSYMVLTVWYAEVMRMFRAGAYLLRLEKYADQVFGRGTLRWESTVWHARSNAGSKNGNDAVNREMSFVHFYNDPDKFRAVAIGFLFMLLAAASIWMGWSSVDVGRKIFAISAAAIALGAVVWLHRLRIDQSKAILSPKARTDLETDAATAAAASAVGAD